MYSGLLLGRRVVFRLKGGKRVTVYEALMLMLTFGIVLTGLLSVIIVIVKNIRK